MRMLENSWNARSMVAKCVRRGDRTQVGLSTEACSNSKSFVRAMGGQPRTFQDGRDREWDEHGGNVCVEIISPGGCPFNPKITGIKDNKGNWDYSVDDTKK
jgi:hypothetical protein